MATPEIIHYIKSELERGVNREVIKASLLKNGWEQELINEAFRAVDSGEAPNPIHRESAEQKPRQGVSGWVKGLIALGVLAVLTPFIINVIVRTPATNTQNTDSNTPEELVVAINETNADNTSKDEQTPNEEKLSPSETTSPNLTLDVQTNYQGNPLSALITCTSNQEMSSWAVASGIPGKVDMSASIGVSSGAQKIVEETYISPGTYTVECSGITLSGKDLVAKKEISIGGGTSQGKVSFTAGSTSGKAPFSTPVTCDYSETVTSISIDYYTPEEMAVIWGQVFAGESDMDIEDMSLTTRISSKGFDEPVSGTFTANEPGTYNLYCTVGLADMTSVTTAPIIITVK